MRREAPSYLTSCAGHAEVPAVILINLLPHARRPASAGARPSMHIGGFGPDGGVIAGAIFLWYAAQISNQQSKNLVLQTEIKRLEARSRTSPPAGRNRSLARRQQLSKTAGRPQHAGAPAQRTGAAAA